MIQQRNHIIRSFSNQILVPPKIAHFDFGDEPSNYGDSASVSCLVTSGDLPIVFKWFFNRTPISEFAGISTAKMGKRNSVMNIDSVVNMPVITRARPPIRRPSLTLQRF